MIELERTIILEPGDPLPDLSKCNKAFIDFETRSGDTGRGGNQPYKGDEICGAAVKRPGEKKAWYVPVIDHHGQRVLGRGEFSRWLEAFTSRPDATWTNHNVKFDAHFARAAGVTDFSCKMLCTLTCAKIIDSDRTRSGGYGLDALSADWLDRDMMSYRKLAVWMTASGTKDYGDVPVDILGEYAGDDALDVERLEQYCRMRLPEEVQATWDLEHRLTPAVFDMECVGLRVDPTALDIEYLMTVHELIAIEDALCKLVGREFNPKSSPQIQEVVCGTFGLPAIAFTSTENDDPDNDWDYNPSFSKDALAAYTLMPEVMFDAKLKAFFVLLLEHRSLSQYFSLFVEAYRDLHVDGVMHPSFNQLVQTGRMSCSKPNAQQLSKRAKKLIIPGEGNAFLRYDYSQVEFRLIVHTTRDPSALAAYAQDPSTDFHTFVAELCEIERSPGKTVNFGVAFGAGKAKVLKMLAADKSIRRIVGNELDALVASGGMPETQRVEKYRELCGGRAEHVYSTYHKKFPGIKKMSKVASGGVVARGYVKTVNGRRRHLPDQLSYRAFNSHIQGSAADLAKERFCATAPRYNQQVRNWGIKQSAIVHDETVFTGDRGILRDPEVREYLRDELEHPVLQQDLRVPILVECGYSDKHWAEASSDSGVVKIPRAGVLVP